MSRENPAEPAQEQVQDLTDWAGQAKAMWERFRESRLYVQTVMALGLVALTGVTAVLPLGPLARLRDGLAWTATHDYDFQGLYRRADGWARERGGWKSAATGVWSQTTGRFERWAQKATATPATPEATPANPKETPATTGDPATNGGGASAATGRPSTVMPVKGAVLYGFGWFSRNQATVHTGLDLAAKEGEEVLAIADGTVRRVGGDTGMGTFVEVDHGFGVAIYGQVHNLKVKAGDKVTQGQALAVVAKPTGREGAAEAHLHLEVWVSGKAVEPVQFLPLAAPQGGSQT